MRQNAKPWRIADEYFTNVKLPHIFRFAFGFPPNSPYLDLFNNVILKFRESSDLETAWEEIKKSGEAKQCGGVSFNQN